MDKWVSWFDCCDQVFLFRVVFIFFFFFGVCFNNSFFSPSILMALRCFMISLKDDKPSLELSCSMQGSCMWVLIPFVP